MSLYSVGVAKAAPATNTVVAVIRPASTDVVQVREIGIFNSTAIASSIGLIRTFTAGTPSTSTLFQPERDGAPAGVANLDTAFTVAPTLAATPIYLRKIVLPATIGAGVIWTFGPGELWASNGATTMLALWNFGAGTAAALEVYVRIDE
ncbi:MAG: hypothetical protein LC798_05620 [Chloroflexi bacterium]|nr:hypothetical protein [Chloroflexota bacterium]